MSAFSGFETKSGIPGCLTGEYSARQFWQRLSRRFFVGTRSPGSSAMHGGDGRPNSVVPALSSVSAVASTINRLFRLEAVPAVLSR